MQHQETRIDLATPVQGHPSSNIAELFAVRGTSMTRAADTCIEAQGEPARTVYRIVRGHVRSCHYTPDGRRTVLQFRGPGDMIGLSDADCWIASHEAVDTVVIEAIPRREFERLVDGNCALQSSIRHHLSEQVGRHASLLVLTGGTTAVDRLYSFLAALASQRKSEGFISLPMPRRDIADYLGISVETVSRAFSTLQNLGRIALKSSTFFQIMDQARTPEGSAIAA